MCHIQANNIWFQSNFSVPLSSLLAFVVTLSQCDSPSPFSVRLCCWMLLAHARDWFAPNRRKKNEAAEWERSQNNLQYEQQQQQRLRQTANTPRHDNIWTIFNVCFISLRWWLTVLYGLFLLFVGDTFCKLHAYAAQHNAHTNTHALHTCCCGCCYR